MFAPLPVRPTAAALMVALLLSPPVARAQEPPPEADVGDVAGRVLDDAGAPVFAADVVLERPGARGERTARRVGRTDRMGTFRIEDVPTGSWDVRAQRLGYDPARTTVEVPADGTVEMILVLARRAIDLPGVEVEAERTGERRRFLEAAGVTARELSLEEIRAVPGVGEADPLRAVQVLPGVVATSDFSSAFHVRGGSADQNLVLLDGIPIFSPFHLGGFFSVFNADMVERAELASGGFPAEHGGRVSSVLTIESDPGEGEIAVDGGVSLLASRATLSGGLSDGTAGALGLASGRWRLSARRSYIDLVLKPVFDFPYHLTDLQGVFDGITKGGGRLRVTAYTGRDVVDLTEVDPDDLPLRVDWDWGNDLVGATWTRTRNDGGALTLRAGYSRFATGLRFPDFDDTEFRSRIHQGLASAALTAVPSGPWRLTAGAEANRMGYDNLARTGGTTFGQGRGDGTLVGAFGQLLWQRPGSWLVEAGVRLDGWHPDGGSSTWVPGPRVAVKRFFDGSHWAVKAAAGRYTQFIHSLRDEELPLGLDIWVLSGPRAPHVESDQLQLGVEGWIGPGESWQLSLEGYYRDFDGVVTFNPADDPGDLHDDILSGTGRSWGADLLVRRTRGEVTGWLALSWLKATRSFPDELAPQDPAPEATFPPVFDRRLDADLVLRFPLPYGWDGGLRWNVGTGLPYTRPLAGYAYYRTDFLQSGGIFVWTGEGPGTEGDEGFAVRLGDRNGARYPNYHRLDVSARRSFDTSWGSIEPYVDVLNVYNRRNVLFYFYEYDESPPVRTGVSMFPVIPSIGVEIRFR